MLLDEPAFPQHAAPDMRVLISVHPATVDLGTDHQYEVTSADLSVAPSGPALRRRGQVAVDHRVDPIGAQTICEREHAIFVLSAVMAVAHKNPWRCRFRQKHCSARHGRCCKSGVTAH